MTLSDMTLRSPCKFTWRRVANLTESSLEGEIGISLYRFVRICTYVDDVLTTCF